MLNDAFLWYNEGDWSDYGLAVPNVGNDISTQNSTIKNLMETMGRNLQNIMWHNDARKSSPPSVNTIERLCKLCVRARDIISSRAVPPGTKNLEATHAVPAPEEFLIFPVPYFKVRNSFLKDYCGLALLCMTEMAQHQENATPLEISTEFGKMVSGYIGRIYRRVGVELLKLPAEPFDTQASFTISAEQIAAYNPALYFTSTEMIDTVPDLTNWPTEDDLEPLTNGIPWSTLPKLGRYPSAAGLGSLADSGIAGAARTVNTENSSFIR